MSGHPNKHLLDRDLAKAKSTQYFNETLSLLEEVVDYGTHLVLRTLASCEKGLADAVVIGGLFKHMVAMLDGFHVLVQHSAVTASNLPLRSLFESSLYIDFILSEDKDVRGRAFYVRTMLEDKMWLLKLISGTQLNTNFISEEEWQPNLSKKDLEDRQTSMRMELKEIEDILSCPDYIELYKQYESTKAKKSGYYKAWYSIFDISSVRAMAIEQNRQLEYEFVYSSGSDVMHATKLAEHMDIEELQLSLKPIRDIEGMDLVLRTALTISLDTYGKMLSHYRKEELPLFHKKYMNEWRGRFRSIPIVKTRYI